MRMKLQFHADETLVSYGGNSSFIRRKLQFHAEETTRIRGEYLVLGMQFAFYFGCLPLSL